jgi:glucose/arabinose dehydrogenase
VRGWRAFALLACLAGPAALAQTPDPFVRPPPGQAPQAPQTPSVPGPQLSPLAPAANTVTLEMLVKQGFEVRAMERTSNTSADFVVMLQRSGEIRTCLMRINRDANRQLKRDTACF